MNLSSAARTVLAMLVAALAGAAVLLMYQQGSQPELSATKQAVVQLERVVIVGKRSPAVDLAVPVVAAPAVVHQLPRVVIEGHSLARLAQPAATLLAAEPGQCVSC